MHSQQKAELNIIYISKKQHKVYHNNYKRKKYVYTTTERHIKNIKDKSKQELNSTTVQTAERS